MVSFTPGRPPMLYLWYSTVLACTPSTQVLYVVHPHIDGVRACSTRKTAKSDEHPYIGAHIITAHPAKTCYQVSHGTPASGFTSIGLTSRAPANCLPSGTAFLGGVNYRGGAPQIILDHFVWSLFSHHTQRLAVVCFFNGFLRHHQ